MAWLSKICFCVLDSDYSLYDKLDSLVQFVSQIYLDQGSKMIIFLVNFDHFDRECCCQRPPGQ